MSQLTTHVLDTANGRPAAGMKLLLYFNDTLLVETVTNSDGRISAPLVQGPQFRPGDYRIEFCVGDYFASIAHPDARRFLNIVPVAFIVDDTTRAYHVPLLVSPWSYSTYRGS